MIDAHDLYHSYGHGRARIVAVTVESLRVRRGELVLLEGPSGSGKTTLISILGALLRPERGHVTIAGCEVDWKASRRLDLLRSLHIGFVFQAFNLLEPLSARQNIEVVLNAAGRKGRVARTRADQLLDRFGLGARSDARVSVLSGGERQRVAIARALALNPDVLLADEPTGNLDTDRGQEVGHLLATLASEGRAVLVATHDPRLEPFATRKLRMVDGSLVADLSSPGVRQQGEVNGW